MQAPDPDPAAPSESPGQERPTDPALTADSPHASGTIGSPIGKPKPSRIVVPILIGAAIVALTGGLLALGIVRENTPGDTRTTPEMTRLQQAAEGCVESTTGITVGDAGKTMIVSGAGGEPTIDELACILRALDVTDAVISQIDQTRALDGRQEADWGDFHASWTYHPDDGVNMVIEER